MGPLLPPLSVCWGHDFPVFFGFKGGKGVLTSWSITLLIDWRLFVITIVVFIVLLFNYASGFDRPDCRSNFPYRFRCFR